MSELFHLNSSIFLESETQTHEALPFKKITHVIFADVLRNFRFPKTKIPKISGMQGIRKLWYVKYISTLVTCFSIRFGYDIKNILESEGSIDGVQKLLNVPGSKSWLEFYRENNREIEFHIYLRLAACIELIKFLNAKDLETHFNELVFFCSDKLLKAYFNCFVATAKQRNQELTLWIGVFKMFRKDFIWRNCVPYGAKNIWEAFKLYEPKLKTKSPHWTAYKDNFKYFASIFGCEKKDALRNLQSHETEILTGLFIVSRGII
ncbi:hypothetical protein CEXT_44141 [Caerostris extrusa]|uniref:LAGLIDADG homing endonuclease n=1 Tax=Caerostris extrusa TaxID=172846 RepID=A0AAV4WDD4_CAEEX|nr:hypothetical protein CEXT_44141 [Caerostris extrusa]